MATVNLRRAKCRLESYWRPLVSRNRLADRMSFLVTPVTGISSIEALTPTTRELKLSPMPMRVPIDKRPEAVVHEKLDVTRDRGPSIGVESTRCCRETETRGPDVVHDHERARQNHADADTATPALKSPVRDQVPGSQITATGLQQVSSTTGTTEKSSSVSPVEQTTTRVGKLPGDSSTSSSLQEMPPPDKLARVAGPTLGSILQRIHLNDGDVSELDFSALAQHNKRLESEGCALVARSLSTNNTVRKLIIRDHDIGDGGAVALSKMLCTNTTLESLELNGNNISDRGAEALAQALYGHDTLTYLCLENNLISDRGADALAQAIRCNCTLRFLGLVHNRITGKGAQALLDALDVNMNLEIINLGANDVPTFVGSQLAATLARNRAESLLLGSHAAEAMADEIVDREKAGRFLDTEDEGEDSSGMEEDWEEEGESASSGFVSCSGATDSPSSSSGLWI
ncbi:unnamed protein product [Hyaloperonospora brassicae]|uniref:RxLR effector candidate protein n=1 Tax=Hyaloperonospora brassicae TaxID=162125 RepID=A0AAV0SZT6_HYABA|nr:unnamed protein product [Hyaloperonospora brassicae]